MSTTTEFLLLVALYFLLGLFRTRSTTTANSRMAYDAMCRRYGVANLRDAYDPREG